MAPRLAMLLYVMSCIAAASLNVQTRTDMELRLTGAPDREYAVAARTRFMEINLSNEPCTR